MPRTTPPFRADEVGSLLRTPPLKAARDTKEATKFAALDQLALSPQCGFASTEEGNTLSQDEQWVKLKLVVDIAREVWG